MCGAIWYRFRINVFSEPIPKVGKWGISSEMFSREKHLSSIGILISNNFFDLIMRDLRFFFILLSSLFIRTRIITKIYEFIQQNNRFPSVSNWIGIKFNKFCLVKLIDTWDKKMDFLRICRIRSNSTKEIATRRQREKSRAFLGLVARKGALNVIRSSQNQGALQY